MKDLQRDRSRLPNTSRTAAFVFLLVVLTTIGRAGAVEVVAAGDIATASWGDTQTSDRIVKIDPDVVLTLGDHAYPSGRPIQFATYYDPTWGRFKSITRPSPGNHDWETAGASGYEHYFGVQAGRMHSFVLGSWRVISLDSSRGISRQNDALGTALAQDDHRCELLFFHHPRWSSGEHGNDALIGPWWRTAYRGGVDVILNGHDHDYERFKMLSPSGTYAADGIREFVVGTGGAGTRPFGPPERGSQKRITGDPHWGVLDLHLRQDSYLWRFVDADTGRGLDSGRADCHG